MLNILQFFISNINQNYSWIGIIFAISSALFFILNKRVTFIIFLLSSLLFSGEIRRFFSFFIIYFNIFAALMFVFLALKKKLFTVIGKSFLFTIVIINFSPIPRMCLFGLEKFVKVKKIKNGDIGGFIILGGNQGRLIKSFMIINKFSDLPIIFTGSYHETVFAKRYLLKSGIKSDRLRFDYESKNTIENAINVKKMIINQKKPWALITSSYHMLRSALLFKKQNIKILPYPIYDVKIPKNTKDWLFLFVDTKNPAYWKFFAKECLGILNNFLLKKI